MRDERDWESVPPRFRGRASEAKQKETKRDDQTNWYDDRKRRAGYVRRRDARRASRARAHATAQQADLAREYANSKLTAASAGSEFEVDEQAQVSAAEPLNLAQ